MRTKYWTDRPAEAAPAAGEGPWCPADVRRAVRRAVARRCLQAGVAYDESALGDALLVASEMTSNAILHGGGVTAFGVDIAGPAVRVWVCDRSERLPVSVAPVDPEGRRRPGGRGWSIICRLSDDVQVTPLRSGGKRVTAVIPVF